MIVKSYQTIDDKDWLLKYMREDSSPVKKGKGFRKRIQNSKNVINESDSDTEKQVKSLILVKIIFLFQI